MGSLRESTCPPNWNLISLALFSWDYACHLSHQPDYWELCHNPPGLVCISQNDPIRTVIKCLGRGSVKNPILCEPADSAPAPLKLCTDAGCTMDTDEVAGISYYENFALLPGLLVCGNCCNNRKRHKRQKRDICWNLNILVIKHVEFLQGCRKRHKRRKRDICRKRHISPKSHMRRA